MSSTKNTPTKLERSLTLPLVVFYGLGTTIGAGIYVLVGTATGYAGIFAPVAFLVAAIAIAPTAASYSELCGRLAVSSGEAAYIKSGFRSKWLSVVTGWMVSLTGIIASATIAIGCAGYIRSIIDVPLAVTIIIIILLLALVAIWGIMESVIFTAIFTIIEAGGLIVLIIFGFSSDYIAIDRLPELVPPTNNLSVWLGIINAGVIAVFAFIGFEGIVNIAEETKKPRTTLPWAIFLTLAITAVLYTLVAIIAVLAVPTEQLAQSESPLSMVYKQLTGASPLLISAIAIFATANTILVQFIMVSRVMYGMAIQKNLPNIFGQVNRITKTPIVATLTVMIITLVLALIFPLESLAELTSQFILAIWTLVNLALVIIKLRKDKTVEGGFRTPLWVPIVGTIFSGVLLIVSFL